MKTLLKIGTVGFLIALFNIGAMLSPLAMILMPWRAGRIFQAQNRLCGAAYLGFDGKQTISATCGTMLRADKNCQPCKAICEALHEALDGPGENHCEDEAR